MHKCQWRGPVYCICVLPEPSRGIDREDVVNKCLKNKIKKEEESKKVRERHYGRREREGGEGGKEEKRRGEEWKAREKEREGRMKMKKREEGKKKNVLRVKKMRTGGVCGEMGWCLVGDRGSYGPA